DFRKWIYALAVVALLAGFTVPASAQAPPFQCVANAGVPPIVRAEGFTEQVGDLTLNCNGGVPTDAGKPIPQVNFQIFLSTNVTNPRRTNNTSGPNLKKPLLTTDEPNHPLNPPRRTLPCAPPPRPPANAPSAPAGC